ncbi:MAG: imidazole glycerol phosphate synthase subunit HisH [Chlorobi bacterium]|nr:imidazole glycerol phosphate synthase subunit HisH [Chlorobiota bacterium]
MLTIINYKAGNFHSIQNMLKKIGIKSIISDKIEDIENADRLIFPGVGSFDYGMQQLEKSGLISVLNNKVLVEKIPVLGICLGAQLLGNKSEEGEMNGLGWINMDIVKFKKEKMPDNYKIPNMGWNEISIKKESSLFTKMPQNPRFYFVHSFYMQANEKSDILATAEYGYEFVAAVEKDNIFGVQFHPEKSHKYGMKLLENFTHI